MVPSVSTSSCHTRHVQFSIVIFLLICALHSTSAASCQPFSEFLRLQFDRFNMYQRRGLSGRIVHAHYCIIVDALISVVKLNYQQAVRLDATWICKSDYDRLSSLVNLNDIENYINDTVLKEPHVFYLRSSRYGDNQLPLSLIQQRLVENTWNIALNEMRNRPADVQTDKLCSLPSAIRMFYDPSDIKLREEFSRQLSLSDDVILAEDLLYQVVALSARLKLLNPKDDTHNAMIRHCIAYNFWAMRATRLERHELYVPNSYIAAYNAMFRSQTKGLNLSEVPPISTDVVHNHLGNILAPLTDFDVGAKLTLIANDQYGNQLLRLVTNRALSSGNLRKMSSEETSRVLLNKVSPVKPLNSSTLYRKRIPFIPWANKQSGTCPSGYFYFSSNIINPCCANLCQTTYYLTEQSLDECCQNCYYSSCDTDNEVVRVAVTFYVTSLDESDPVIEVTL